MKEELRVNEKTVEEPEGLRLLLTQVGLKHIAETLQQLPQSTYEAITTLMRSALDRLSPKYQQVAWSLVLATVLNACTGIEQASAQSKTVTPDQPGKPTLVTPTPTKEARKTPPVTPTATPQPEVTATPTTIEVIDVAGGINRRKAPNGPIIDTTPGPAQEITTYKRTKAQPVKAGGYTWYEATDGDQTFWVALLEGKVTLRTEQVSTGTGGEQNEAGVLVAAQAVAPDAVKVVILPDGNRFAVNAADMVIARVDLGGTGQWYALTVAEPTPEIETEEMSSLEQTLFNFVPDEIKDQVAELEFDEKAGAWQLPDGIHYYLPIQTEGVPSLEQGIYDPSEGFTIVDLQTESRLSFNLAPDALLKTIRWKNPDDPKAVEWFTLMKAELGVPPTANINIVLVKDVTGRNPAHLHGKTIEYGSVNIEALEKMLILFGTARNGQVIVDRDDEGNVSTVTIFVSRKKGDFAETPDRIKGEVIAFDVMFEALTYADAAINQRGDLDYYMLQWGDEFGDKINALLYPDGAASQLLFDAIPNLK